MTVTACERAGAMTTVGKNRIMIFGPKSDGTYVIEFRTAAGEPLAISIPGTERLPLLARFPPCRHFGVEFEQFLQPLSIVSEPAADIDARGCPSEARRRLCSDGRSP
jgi:hypothetical protein